MSINENEGLAEGLKDFCGFKKAYIRGHFLPLHVQLLLALLPKLPGVVEVMPNAVETAGQ